MFFGFTALYAAVVWRLFTCKDPRTAPIYKVPISANDITFLNILFIQSNSFLKLLNLNNRRLLKKYKGVSFYN